MQTARIVTIDAVRWRAVPAVSSRTGRVVTLGAIRLEQPAPGLRTVHADEGQCRFLFQPRGSSLLVLDERSVCLSARQWCALGAGPLDLHAGEDAELYLVTIPLDHLSRRLAGEVRAHRWVARPLQNAAQMAIELAHTSLDQAGHINASVEQVLGDSLAELVKLAVTEQLCVKRVETVRETVRARIEAFIQRNLVDPDLSIERIAARLQCTKRYLHKVFSDEGQTLSQYIWAQRLEHCRADLVRPDLADKSITEIAFGWGFSNAAHFSRSFRARFGQPPRAYRRALTPAGAR